jgi:hypothetical protein
VKAVRGSLLFLSEETVKMLTSLWLAIIAPVPTETPDPNAEPMSISRMLFFIGAGAVLLILVLFWLLNKTKTKK